MERRVIDDYIVPPRLAGVEGQIMQGDVFRDVPFLRMDPIGGSTFRPQWGLLLTPTCDFALKVDHAERQLIPIEPIERRDQYPDQSSSSALPLHLLLLPPLSAHLPNGGIVHFRRAQEVHAESLQPDSRVATINEEHLRRLLAAHTAYYTRAAIDPANIPVAVDDPRLLWSAIDEAETTPGLAAKRTALAMALEIAIHAIAKHHGISAPSTAMTLAWLEELTTRNVFPLATRKIVREISRAQKAILALYTVVPADLPQKKTEYQRLVSRLESVGVLLQERTPKQLTAQHLRDAGIANLLRS